MAARAKHMNGLPEGLTQRENGVFYIRYRVRPEDEERYSTLNIVRSLRTTNVEEALERFFIVKKEIEEELEDRYLRKYVKPKVSVGRVFGPKSGLN